jgi:hypothetical protein
VKIAPPSFFTCSPSLSGLVLSNVRWAAALRAIPQEELDRDFTGFFLGGRHVFGEILERLVKIGGHPNLPLHPSHPALRLS